MIALHEAALFRLELRARMPFRYGIATMTGMPHVFLRLGFDFDGVRQVGFSADNLPPKWFTKDPAQSFAAEIETMLGVIRVAVAQARAVRAATPFEFWRELYERQAAWAGENKIPPLLAHFGTSLVERALIDAFCRARGIPFAQALRENIFGIDLGSLRAELAGSAPRDWLPTTPAPQIVVRHTVGLSDPIEAADLAPGERVDDGLPQALAECVRFYGLRHFKIKINGAVAEDRDRLTRIAAMLQRERPSGDYAFSLDGNESFRDVASFAAHAREIVPAVSREFWSRRLFIEQPLHREVALTDAARSLAHAWPGNPPVIIDESDASLDSLPAALRLGYAGTSHKNCKGVFKGVANACLLARRRAAGTPALLSGEDLSNVGPVALPQDLAVQASLGIASVERNGQHYFAGLSPFPAGVQQAVLQNHGDLFVAHRHGAANWPRVDIRGGRLALGSVLAAPFGYAEGVAGALADESLSCVALE